MNNRFCLFIFTILSFFLSSLLAYGQTSPDRLLLRNYRPQNIFKIPYIVGKKAEYPVIDMNARPSATSQSQLAQWVKDMDSAGVGKTVIMTDAYGRQFDSLAAFYSRYPKRFVLFCGIDLTGYDKPGFELASVKELKRCYDVGARGVGELIDLSRGFVHQTPPAYWVHIDDPKLAPLLNECAKLGMPVSISIGQPQWCYERMDSTNDGLMSAYEHWFDMGWDLDLNQEVQHLARALAEHPKTIFIACHLGNQVTDLAKLGKLFDKYPNLYADISRSYAELATIPRYAKTFLENYRYRILYGTDMGTGIPMYQETFTVLQTCDEHFYAFGLSDYHWPLYGLGLSGTTLKSIYRGNAKRILK